MGDGIIFSTEDMLEFSIYAFNNMIKYNVETKQYVLKKPKELLIQFLKETDRNTEK